MKKRLIDIAVFAACLLLVWHLCCTMAHSATYYTAFALVQMEGGYPKIDQQATPYLAHHHVGHVKNWGAYLITGTGQQLLAIDALPQVIGICAVTRIDDQNDKWPELNEVINATKRTKINNWLSARGYPTIPAAWTNRQVILGIYKRLNGNFEIESDYVIDAPIPAPEPPAEGGGE